MASPVVTIGIIAAETGQGLEKTLASVRAQSYGNREVVVLSPEDPGEPAANWVEASAFEPIAARYDKLRALAQQDYLLVLDDRTWIDPEFISKSVAFLESNSDHVAVYGSTVFEHEGISETCLPVAIQASEPGKRVETLLRHVTHIGPWYGLRRRLAADLPLTTSLGAELYYLTGLAWAGPIGVLGDIECRLEAEAGFHLSRSDAIRLGCPAYQEEDPAVAAIALIFCGFGIIDSKYASLSMLERLRLASFGEQTIRERTQSKDDILLIPYCSRLFSQYNITKEFRDIRHQMSVSILNNDPKMSNLYISNIVNPLCRFCICNLSPDERDAATIRKVDSLLKDNPSQEVLNRVTLVGAMYY